MDGQQGWYACITQDTGTTFFFSISSLLIPRSATWNAWSLLVTAPIIFLFVWFFGNASHDIALFILTPPHTGIYCFPLLGEIIGGYCASMAFGDRFDGMVRRGMG
ncbi:hypothetical protein F5Y11DRAFT_294366 [Daldinia sp. FL1419]|nr:hypothetical protein F5Y11DRAFT_294366 [Daldinia sp. FL1419]